MKRLVMALAIAGVVTACGATTERPVAWADYPVGLKDAIVKAAIGRDLDGHRVDPCIELQSYFEYADSHRDPSLMGYVDGWITRTGCR